MHFFGEAPERRPWIVEHDDAGRFLPGFLFALRFLAGEATHRFCYRAGIPKRIPRACEFTPDGNCPNGAPKSTFGLLVQLNCAQDWPGKPPILNEKIAVP